MPTDNRTDVNAATAMMIYMSAQNELAPKATENIDAIKSNVALDNLCLYIVEDTYDNLVVDDPSARTTFHYRLPRGAKETDFNRQSFGNMDKTIGDPAVFKRFLERAKEHFHNDGTNQKILVLWGHGGGLVLLDEENANGTIRARASIAEFAEVLEHESRLPNALKFDIVAFDSCYMGVIEAMNQLREATSYALVSSTVVAADGYPYETFIRDLKDHGPTLDPKTAAAHIATCYDDHYKQLLPDEERFLFTCDMKKIEDCAVALNEFGNELSSLLGPNVNDDPVRDAISEALIAAHADYAYVPVLIFMRKLGNRLAIPLGPDKLENLGKAGRKLANTVKAAFAGKLSDTGYTPTSPLIWSPDGLGLFLRDYQTYNQLDSSKNGDGGWTKFWRKFHGVAADFPIKPVLTSKFGIGIPKSVLFGLL